MKNLILLSIAIAIFALAVAVAYHAQTGRYQIAHVAGVTGVYKADTKTGELSICSPVYERGCITMVEAHAHIIQQRENVANTAQQASDKINEFTREKAQDLRSVIQKFAPDAPAQSE